MSGIEQDDEQAIVTGRPHVLTAQWILPVSSAPIENAYIAFANGKITDIGKISDLLHESSFPQPRPGSLITPGLINCHIHLEQSFPQVIQKQYQEPFTSWLLDVVSRIKDSSSPAEKTQRCQQGADELLQTGTTCINDIASGPESVQVLAEKGLRGIISLEVFHPGVAPLNIEHWVQAYQRLQQETQQSALLLAGLSPHSPYNVSPAAWEALLNACQPPVIHTHIAEFPDEQYYLQERPSTIPDLHHSILNQRFVPQAYARSSVQYLYQFKLLNSKTIAAHVIETDTQDRQLLAQAGVGIAHCPRSNIALHGKTLEAHACKDTHIPIGLGTDGRLSTEDLDLRAEARYAIQQHGWEAKQALEAMTIQGARVLKLEHAIGSLEVGKEADLVVWHADKTGGISPEALVLEPSTTVEQTIIAGVCQWQRRVG